MASIEFDGMVCVDCLMVIANGDTSGIDDLDAWETRVEANNATENGCYAVVPFGDSEADFRHTRCDYCGIYQGGDYHQVAFLAN